MNRGNLLKAALMGGALSGLACSIPSTAVQLTQLCCCAPVVAGGLFAAWVLRSDSLGTASTMRCGVAGLTAGWLSGLIQVPLHAVLSRLVNDTAELEEMLQAGKAFMEQQNFPFAPGWERSYDAMQRAQLGLEFGPWTIVLAVATAAFVAFPGMLGGLLGALLFTRSRGAGPRGRSAPVRPAAAGTAGPAAGVSPAVVPPPPPPWEGQPDDDGPTESGTLEMEELPRLPEAPDRATDPDDDEAD